MGALDDLIDKLEDLRDFYKQNSNLDEQIEKLEKIKKLYEEIAELQRKTIPYVIPYYPWTPYPIIWYWSSTSNPLPDNTYRTYTYSGGQNYF